MWQFVSAPVTTLGNRHCVVLPIKGAHQFYRLCRREVNEVDAADNLFPPLGTYRSPDDLVTSFFVVGDPDRPLLMRRFAQPIPPDTPRRPPPCPGCPPDLHEVQAQIMFEVSTDGGETWSFYGWPCKWLAGLQSDTPPDDYYQTEIIYLEARGTTDGLRIRESPTRPSLGRTFIYPDDNEGYWVDSFFDVWIEISMDDGQTWHPADTDVPMSLTKP
jgi:hypothetical protein